MIYCDSHIHLGQFYDIYTSPERLVNMMKEIGINKYAVSSTTTCEDDFNAYCKVCEEMRALEKLAFDSVYPVLWLSPKMVEYDKALKIMLDNQVDWCCVKIHPRQHPYWTEDIENIEKAIIVAQDLKVPLLIHTGDDDFCQAKLFEVPIAKHPEQIFILAHSRPIDQTLALLEKYPNVYCDTAFASIESIVKLVESGFVERTLWGTDLPIQEYFDRNVDIPTYYNSRIKELVTKVDFGDLLTMCGNFDKVFVHRYAI